MAYFPSGTVTYATLPPIGQSAPGSLEMTKDAGLCISDGSKWIPIPGTVLPGLFSALPTIPTLPVGTVFTTTDQGSVSWNGTAWVSASTGSSPVFGNVTLTGYLVESFNDNITAHAGGGQALATALTAETNRITTVATTGDSVMLPPSKAGLTIIVTNHGNNPMQVYGQGTDTIDDVAYATGVQQMQNSEVIYCCFTPGAWYCNGLASGFVRGQSLQTFSSAVIAANAGGTQATGTPINQMLVNVTTTGAGQSVTLPASAPGVEITVHNISSNSMLCFPSAAGTGTETINTLAANAPLTFPANTSTVMTSTVAGQWYSVPRVPS